MNAILFDLDGTLIDSTEGIINSFDFAFDAFGMPRANKEEICSLIGYPLEDMFTKLGVDGEVDGYVKKYKENYEKIATKTTVLLANAKEAIELAATLAPLAVVTTKTAKYSKEILEYFDVAKYFKVIIGRENVIHPKPHKEPILKALQFLGVKADMNSYMIGDTCLDMNSAFNAKINAIGVLGGYSKEEELKKCSPKIALNALEAIKILSIK